MLTVITISKMFIYVTCNLTSTHISNNICKHLYCYCKINKWRNISGQLKIFIVAVNWECKIISLMPKNLYFVVAISFFLLVSTDAHIYNCHFQSYSQAQPKSFSSWMLELSAKKCFLCIMNNRRGYLSCSDIHFPQALMVSKILVSF